MTFLTFHRALRCLTMAWGVLPCSAGTVGATEPSCHGRTVALQRFDSRALVALAINGHKTHLILDTGANETVLFRDVPDRLGLQPSPNLTASQTTSYGQVFSIHFVRADIVDFAHTLTHSVDLAVLPTTLGSPVTSGFFADPRLQEAEFDLADEFLHLACPPFTPPRWTRQGNVATVPLETVGRVFGAGSIKGVTMRVLFDTGSPTSSITLAAARRAGIPVEGPSDITVAGLAPGSALRAWAVKVDAVRLGDGNAAEMPMLIVDKPHANADMIIGFDFFARHRVWIDRSRHVLRFTGAKGQAH